MPNNKRTIYLGLDYSQFSGGVTEINRKMGLLDAEFKLAQERAKNYGNETDTLSLKTEYLTQKINLQNQKVEEAKRAYDAAMSSQTASAKEIDELDKKLLKERTTLEQLNGQLKEAKEDTDKATDSNKTLGEVFESVASVLGINVSPALTNLTKKLDGVSVSLGATIGILGAGVTALTKLSVQTAKNCDELLTLSAQTDMSVEEIQRLKYAADFVDVSFETLQSATVNLTKNMGKARDGAEKQEEAFKKLHIRIKDGRGQLRDANEVFNETIDKLGKVKNETERDVLANELFGRSYQDLKPLIKAGSEELEKYKKEADEVAYVMDEKTVKNFGSFSDVLDKLHAKVQAVKDILGEVLLPILEGIGNIVSSIPAPILAITVVGGAVILLITRLVSAISILTTAMAAHTGVQTVFNGVSLKTIPIIMAIVAALVLLGVVIASIIGKTNDLSKGMNEATSATSEMQKVVNDASANVNVVKRNASGTDNWEGGQTWVGEEGPELVTLPRGSRITPAGQTGTGTVINYNYITIDAKNVKDFNHVVELAQQQQMAMRRA